MSNRLNDELLSAYLDDEVTDGERAQVEQALADSPDTRTRLESLKQVQARIQSIPSLALPADFHERVVREAEQRAAQVARAAPAKRLKRVAAIGATVAAALVIALVIAMNQPKSAIVENQGSPDDPGGTVDPAPRDVVEQPLPGDEVMVAAPARPQPQMIMVLDLAITKQAQKADVFGKTLNAAGIAFDPTKEGVVLDEKLRKSLLATRFAAGVDQPAEGKVNEKFDIIDMVYIQGTGGQIDQIHDILDKHKDVRAKLDFAYKPESMRVFNSIGEKSWSLAKADSKTDQPQSYGYRLNVGVTLFSSREGFFAKFPTPGFDFRLEQEENQSRTGFSFPIPFDLEGNAGQPLDANGNPVNVNQDPIYETLIIRRNLVAGFPKNAQKPDPK